MFILTLFFSIRFSRYNLLLMKHLHEQFKHCSMEMEGIEPLTPCLQGRCSPS